MIKDTPVIFSKSIKGKKGVTIPKSDVPRCELSKYLKADFIRNFIKNIFDTQRIW